MELSSQFFNKFKTFFRSSASPESGLGTSHTSLHGSGQENTNEQLLNEDMYYEVEPLQPLGICKALYAFDGEFFCFFFNPTVPLLFPNAN